MTEKKVESRGKSGRKPTPRFLCKFFCINYAKEMYLTMCDLLLKKKRQKIFCPTTFAGFIYNAYITSLDTKTNLSFTG